LKEVKSVPKVVFRFFEVIVKDDDIVTFVKKMEEVLTRFAGSAYHFRYYIEGPPDTARRKPQGERFEKP
jgi:hypothetical protein